MAYYIGILAVLETLTLFRLSQMTLSAKGVLECTASKTAIFVGYSLYSVPKERATINLNLVQHHAITILRFDSGILRYM